MELTISTLTYIMAGVLVFGVSLLVYMYFNGGIQHNIDLLLGLFAGGRGGGAGGGAGFAPFIENTRWNIDKLINM